MYKTRDQLLLEQIYTSMYEAEATTQQPQVAQQTQTTTSQAQPVTPQPAGDTQPQTSKIRINTFGDLVKLIKGIELKRKGKQLANQATSFAVDQVIGLIPGGSNIKTAFDFFKTVASQPDTKKTNTVIDKLNVDDQVSMIVDDRIENAFLKHMLGLAQKYNPNQPIPPTWNMTKELERYIKQTYKNRSISVPGDTNNTPVA